MAINEYLSMNTVQLLRAARDFLAKSRCSQGHSVSEIRDRASRDHMGHCLYCQRQIELYEALVARIETAGSGIDVSSTSDDGPPSA